MFMILAAASPARYWPPQTHTVDLVAHERKLALPVCVAIMGLISTVQAEIEALRRGSWKLRLTTAIICGIVLYLLLDAHRLGDTLADALTARGWSLLNNAKLSLAVDEEPAVDNADDGDGPALAVLVRGTMTPCRAGQQVQISLVENDNPALPTSVDVGTDCAFQMKEALTVTHPGRYDVLATSSGWHSPELQVTWRLKRVSEHAVETSALLSRFIDGSLLRAAPRAKGGAKFSSVSIVYLGRPNFSRFIFESALASANPLLEATSLAFIDLPEDTKLPQDHEGYVDTEDLLAILDSLESTMSPDTKPGLLIGISARRLRSRETKARNLFVSRRGGVMLLSSGNIDVVNPRSQPSVYKYLLTSAIVAGTLVAAHPSLKLDFHDATRGCLLDYSNELARIRLGIENANLCHEDRERLTAVLSTSEMRDLAVALPLQWLH